MVAVGRVELDRVMVDVDARALDRRRLPGLAAVGAALDVDVDGPDPIGAIRIDEDLVVVLRAAAAIAVVGRERCRGHRTAAPPVLLLSSSRASTSSTAMATRGGRRRSGPRRSRRCLCPRGARRGRDRRHAEGRARRRWGRCRGGVAAAARRPRPRPRGRPRPSVQSASRNCRHRLTGRSPIRAAWRR